MNEKGTWTVSPAYDLTYSSGPAGEHCTMIMGEGKNPSIAHLTKLADALGIKKQKALQVVDEVKSAVSKWNMFAKEAGVSKSSQNMIQKYLNILLWDPIAM